MNNSLNGLDLINSSQANLSWFLNSSHSNNLTKQGASLLNRINDDFISGIENLYHFNHFQVMKYIDTLLPSLTALDPIAQAVDIRLLHNLQKNETLEMSRIIKAPSINLTYND